MPPIPDCPEEIPADKRLIRFSATTVLRLNPLAHKTDHTGFPLQQILRIRIRYGLLDDHRSDMAGNVFRQT